MPDERTIFAEALGKTSSQERSAYLDIACGGDAVLRARVQALLDAHDHAGSFLESPPPGLIKSAEGGTSTTEFGVIERPGAMVGAYKLLEQIGEGGMGVVFMAEQLHPVRRRVALKIVKPGMDSAQVIARFEAERQALAMMDHPNIAKVLEAGATNAGRPYFVMELVKGIPLTEYCDQNQLTPRQRLELFVQVCGAVQHAHTKGIIHRDLKPANVLVTVTDDGKPVPKVIDFGIAKAMAGEPLTERTLFTEFRQLVGTPLYMSPEQAQSVALLDVDTRSDVYSLGVLLYELLTGTTPFEKHRLAKAAHDEVRRIIREEDPPRPSTRLSTLGQTLSTISAQRQTDPKKLGSIVRGELDWIVMKALEKDRRRRYETANGLASDVERYLSDQPVEACPPSTWYRSRKFVRRNKPMIVTVGLVALALLIGTVVSSWQAVRARHAQQQASHERDDAQAEKRRADKQAAIAKAVSDFQQDMLKAADPTRLLGDKVTVLQATQAAIKRLDGGALKDQPEVEAAVRQAIGDTLRALSRYDAAEPVLRRAVQLFRTSLPGGDGRTADAIHTLSRMLAEQGRFSEAEALNREALDLARRLQPPDDGKVAAMLNSLGDVLSDDEKLPEAEAALRESHLLSRKGKSSMDPPAASSENSLAMVLTKEGKSSEAEPMFREVLAYKRSELPPLHPHIALAANNLASALMNQGKLDEAEPLFREAVEINRKVLPADHPDLALVVQNLADVLYYHGKLADSEPLYREALASRRKTFPVAHPTITSNLNRLVDLLIHLGRFDEAEKLLREELEIRRRAVPRDDLAVSESLHFLGSMLRDQQRVTDAEPLLRESLQILRKSLPPDTIDIGQSSCELGLLLVDEKRYAEAEPLLREQLDIYQKDRPPGHPDLATSISNVALVLYDLKKLDEAESLYRQALAIDRKAWPDGNFQTVIHLNGLGSALRDQGKLDEADAVYHESLAVCRKCLPPIDRDTGWTLRLLGNLAVKRGKPDQAEALLRESLSIERQALPADHPDITAALNDLAACLKDQQRPDEAQPLLREVEARRDKARGPATLPATQPTASVNIPVTFLQLS